MHIIAHPSVFVNRSAGLGKQKAKDFAKKIKKFLKKGLTKPNSCGIICESMRHGPLVKRLRR